MPGSPHDSAAIDLDNRCNKWNRNAWIAAIDNRAGTHSSSISKPNMVDGIVCTAGSACNPSTDKRRTALRASAADKMMIAVAVNDYVGHGGNGFCEHIAHNSLSDVLIFCGSSAHMVSPCF
jgi:predicted amidohydrolase